MAEATDLIGQIRQNLKDADCPDEMIDAFLCACVSKREKEGMRLLREHRKSLLDAVHANQKRIDCLDYLLNKLKL